ncbi:MAG: YqaA family protein [Marinifilaceae bacterium]
MTELFEYGYLGLFLAGFLSATLLPFSSEAILSMFLYSDYDFKVAIGAASLGNWLGGMSTYYLGYLGKWEWIEKYLRIKKERVERTRKYLFRKGSVLAFFAWLPFIGDVIPLGLGLLRSHPVWVAFFMLLGKILRYLVWAWLTLQVI